MIVMTSDRCPHCDSIAYMLLHPKQNKAGEVIVYPEDGDQLKHAHADGCYLDRDGVLCITRFDDNTLVPDYVCIFCGWES